MKLKVDGSLSILSPPMYNQTLELEDDGITVFDELVLNFFSELSKLILSDTRMKDYPELVSFGFFCRRANLNKMRKIYSREGFYMSGKGIVFHITPGNVPMNFAYSLFSGLISGNVNIVRVPSKNFIEVDLLLKKLNTLLANENYQSLTKRILIIRYSSNSSWTACLSKQCDLRVLWGGDKTINLIRQNPIKSSATEITFYDRLSACIIDCKSILELTSLKKFVSDFYVDTLFYDQNACTSPKQIFWLGNSELVKEARLVFWKEFQEELLRRKYTFPVNSTVGKVTTVMEKLASGEDLEPIKFESSINPLINVGFHTSFDIDENDFAKAGLFFETPISSINETAEFLTKKHQTLSYFGFDKLQLKDFISATNPNIDRIVPVGRTMDFSLTWDGYDLISSLSKFISLT